MFLRAHSFISELTVKSSGMRFAGAEREALLAGGGSVSGAAGPLAASSSMIACALTVLRCPAANSDSQS